MNSISAAFTASILVVYFGFIYCFAFGNDFMGKEIVQGLTVGLVVAPSVIVAGLLMSIAYLFASGTIPGRESRP